MERITHDVVQGTPEWLALRAQCFTASEAPAMMGASKYQSRTELLRQKATGLSKEVDAGTQRLFDAGHAAEENARPIVEAMIADDLYPVTMSCEIDGLKLLASMDGLTMDGATGWEHKLFSASLESQVLNEELEPHYYWQLEQEALVSGAEKIVFTTSDGTDQQSASMTYVSVPTRRAQLIAGWKQFAVDLANYQHVEVLPAAVAAPIAELPVLDIQISGRVVGSNLVQWKDVVVARIADINADLKTDTDFATAESTVKWLDDGEKRIDLVKAQAQAQASDIDSVFRAMDEIKAMMRSKRLELDKLVKARKESIRVEIMQAAQAKLADHVKALNERIGWFNGCPIISPAAADFATAIKGKKTVSSLRDACDTELARAKIATSEIADRIEANRKAMGEHASLFPDFPHVCNKAPSDFANLVAVRVQQHREAEDRRIQERAREEEQRKAEEERKAAAAACAANERAPNIQTEAPNIEQVAPNIDDGNLVSVSDINRALGFTVTGDFLATLGFTATHVKAAKLYKASEYGSICAAIVKHIKTTSVTQLKRAA